MANYSLGGFVDSIPDVEDGHTFENDNFLQLYPHTKLFEGKTGLKFKNCNLRNCDVPPDSILESSPNYHVEFCSHNHEKWIPKGLAQCPVNCSHLASTDTITIDGVVVDTVYHYEDKVVS